jgi:hypothetical protein
VNSTPWVEQGLLYELHEKNHGSPTTCVAVHAPTLVMRSDTPSIVKMIERETARDPENASREYGAEFMTRGAGLFFDASAIARAIPPSDVLTSLNRSRMRYAAGADPGFTRDSATMVVVGTLDAKVYVIEVDEMRHEKGKPLVPSEVVGRWATIAKRYGIENVLSDIHYRESVREHLTAHGLKLSSAPDGQSGKRTMYEKSRTLMNEGRLILPPSNSRLITQLRAVVSRPTPGGGMTISSPRRGGAHGDIVSALVAAVFASQKLRSSFGNLSPLASPYGRDEDDEDATHKANRYGWSL